MKTCQLLVFLIFSLILSFSSAEQEQCGRQAEGALCPNGLCCSDWGFCGNTESYCEEPGCQSQCTPTPPSPDTVADTISKSQFEDMVVYRNDDNCPAKGFYTYDAFLTAAKSFPGFGTTGDTATRKQEIAAFFGQTAMETDAEKYNLSVILQYHKPYCLKDSLDNKSDYCSPSTMWPCAPDKRYYGRGPIQLSGNYNYGQCGRAIGVDLLNHPEIVSNDSVIAYKTAIWFWMTPQPPKPSCHAVITGQWQPSDADHNAGRTPGYGVITNIVTNGYECGFGPIIQGFTRMTFHLSYCGVFGVNTGDNEDCFNQMPFDSVNFSLDAAI